jgi:hypothetical protein
VGAARLGALLVLLAALAWAAPVSGQGQRMATEDGAPPLDPVVELEPLLSVETEQWFEALNALRANPPQSRELLLLAIEEGLELPRRWRIFHHIAEFGRMEDIPVLLERLATVENPQERKALRGAAQALYYPANRGEELGLSVEEFSFLQTRRPAPLNGDGAGKLTLSRETFRMLHLAGLPVTVIRRLLPLRGRTYKTEERLGKALQRSLKKKEWKAHREVLLAEAERIRERVVLEGTLRVGLRNPLQRPLMVRIRYEAWFGRFDPPPESVFLYAEPGGSARHDLPVRLIRERDRPAVRVDLRMWEVHGEFVPAFQKLYITQ